MKSYLITRILKTGRVMRTVIAPSNREAMRIALSELAQPLPKFALICKPLGRAQ